jgi:[acyl-carrier-protein] S-malonyltransferase
MRAFIFPGQGSQQVGMGRDLSREFPAARRVFDRADDALGFSVSKLCFDGPADALMLTENCQPAILTASVAALEVLQEETRLSADAVAGHSLGEYTALVCAGALDFEDAVRVVRARGELMQRALPVGATGMAAILGMNERDVERLCADAAQGDTLVPAVFNGPQQIVVAGHAAAVDRAIEFADQRNAGGARLAVSGAFHCPLMRRAAEDLAALLQGVVFRAPRMPVVSNVDAAPNVDPLRMPGLLVEQMTKPVRWADCIARMADDGVDEFVEIGVGGILTRLMRQARPGAAAYGVCTVEDVRRAAASDPPDTRRPLNESLEQREMDDARFTRQDDRAGGPESAAPYR